jgi:integrase
LSKNYVFKRGNTYIYRRRIPIEISTLDKRREIKVSLKTKDYSEALIRSTLYNQEIESYWADLLASQSKDSEKVDERYKAAVRNARLHGFSYKTIDQISKSSLDDIVKRLLLTDIEPKDQAEAILGGAGDNQIKLSSSIEIYWDLVHDRLFNKSEHQIRKWKNPRRSAMKNFIKVVGDKSLQDVSRTDVLAFRKWWNERLKMGMSPISANKQMRFVKDILQVVAINNEVNVDYEPLFSKVNFRNDNKSRPPFEVQYVQNTLLKSLDGLSARDSSVVLAMADTGARLAEIFGLEPEDIKLESEIPHIWIRPREGYSLKTKTSERKIPLVGTALEAFKSFPEGFEHLGNPDVFSNIVNKYLTANNLRPTPQHSIYSLRHTFKDRLRDIEAPEEIIDDLMGHKKSGPKYGRGYKLETKYKWLKSIAFKA